MTEFPPTQKLHVRLLRKEIREVEEAFEKGGERKTHKIRREFGFSGYLYIANPKQSAPKWFEFVKEGMEYELKDLTNRTNGAVLLVKRSGRIFAFTFGQGRHLIKTSSFVSDFGIKTALNGLKHDNLRSLDTFTVEEQTIHKRTQASKLSNLRAFGVDVGRDILKSVVGSPREDVPDNIRGLSGSETVAVVQARIGFSGLGKLCDDLLLLYRKKTYRENFGWVDNIKIVRDPERIDGLNKRVIEDLRKGADCLARLSPPETIDWSNIQGFSYSGQRDFNDDDMSIDHYLGRFRNLRELTIQHLVNDKAFAFADDGSPVFQWSIYNCLVFELQIGDKFYLLINGDWFEIENDFAKSIRASLKRIHISDDLPEVIQKSNGSLESEKDYNERIGRQIENMAVLDRKLVRCHSAHTFIEACDLFSSAGKMIHVKHRKGGSSSLSHLFAQARVSAESFVSDETYRKELRKVLRDLNPAWENRIPVSPPDMARYPFELAILGVRGKNFLDELPFFSQLTLVRTVEALESRRISVSVAGVRVRRP